MGRCYSSKNQSEVSKYLVPITVKIYDEKGKSTTMTLTVHKKLAEEFKAVFEDMYKIKFRIKASQTAAYVWKNISGTGTISQHSYGLAIDISGMITLAFIIPTWTCQKDMVVTSPELTSLVSHKKLSKYGNHMASIGRRLVR